MEDFNLVFCNRGDDPKTIIGVVGIRNNFEEVHICVRGVVDFKNAVVEGIRSEVRFCGHVRKQEVEGNNSTRAIFDIATTGLAPDAIKAENRHNFVGEEHAHLSAG